MWLSLLSSAHAFCGTYVGAEGAELLNEASQVVLAFEGGRTTLTLVPDYQGSLTEFGLIIPLPAIVDAEDVRTISMQTVARLEDFSTPRLVEYTCDDVADVDRSPAFVSVGCHAPSDAGSSSDVYGEVTVEASFTEGEYAIVVLSATESAGLLTWLEDNGYAAPAGGEAILQEYIDAGVYFLAAKVSLADMPSGRNWLAPLQIGYDADNWMLPIRIGTISAGGAAQEVLIYTLADSSVGISNYPQVVPEDECMLPVGDDFVASYLDELDVEMGGEAAWVEEYSWNLTTNCDPCSQVLGLTPEELAELGRPSYHGWLTRLRVRYTPEQATEDLTLYETGLAEASQIRYIRYLPELESRFPVCGEGMVESPGTCPLGASAVITCAAPGSNPGGLAAVLSLLALVSGRRRP